MKDIIDLLARVFISSIFIFEALDSIFHFEKTKETMTVYGLTWEQDFLLYTTIIVLMLGGIMVLIGYYAHIGALLLLVYYLPVTLIIYSFWNDPIEVQRIQSLNFMKNIGVCGGLMLMMINRSGKYSIKKLIHVMRLPG